MKSDQELYRHLNRIAIPDPFMSWAKYLNLIRNADREFLCATPVSFELELESVNEKRIVFFVSTLNKDHNVQQYGGMVFGFNVNKNTPNEHARLRQIHYICVETGARVREAYLDGGNYLFDRFLFKYRKGHSNIIKRIESELTRLRVL